MVLRAVLPVRMMKSPYDAVSSFDPLLLGFRAEICQNANINLTIGMRKRTRNSAVKDLDKKAIFAEAMRTHKIRPVSHIICIFTAARVVI